MWGYAPYPKQVRDFMFLAWAVAAACLLAAPASAWTSGKVGGACAYESYPGFAQIVSVKELPADETARAAPF